MQTPTKRAETLRKLGAMIQDIRVAMLTTIDTDGFLRSRPMATPTTDFDGHLWFLTRTDAAKVEELERDERVNLSYTDPDRQRYVSISGTARLVRDRQKAAALWSPLHQAWFPQGLNDPELALLRVDVEKAEYWDAPSRTMIPLFGLAQTLATGEPCQPVGREKIDLATR
ncbi:MAG: pyridoxamine 5'-phosphate oxidase family protein [Isosphaeraceae bacterium]|nr:pyridoxamine 5'-phosphate oxidase family protein [Isosphaeraceae bacterium]